MSGSQSTVSYSLCVGVDIAATTATVAWMRPGEKVCRPVIIEQTPPAHIPPNLVVAPRASHNTLDLSMRYHHHIFLRANGI